MKGYIILTWVFTNVFICISCSAKAQADWKLLSFASSHTAFPDANRLAGYNYDGKFFEAAAHYSDSSVLLVIPKSLKKQTVVNLVFWFHGWNNNIDSALSFFQLAKQFNNAHPNAVLVLSETAKNAPDSYAGKLEQPGVFNDLVNDVLNVLKKEKNIPANCLPGRITIAGHSGAYRAIAYILQNAGSSVQEVELFDALYSQTDKFINWIQKDSANRFIHWYTNHGGGTDEVSVQMMDQLKKINIPFMLTEEAAVTKRHVQSSRILFVHSTREHNDIINNPDNFGFLLVNSPQRKLSR